MGTKFKLKETPSYKFISHAKFCEYFTKCSGRIIGISIRCCYLHSIRLSFALFLSLSFLALSLDWHEFSTDGWTNVCAYKIDICVTRIQTYARSHSYTNIRTHKHKHTRTHTQTHTEYWTYDFPNYFYYYCLVAHCLLSFILFLVLFPTRFRVFFSPMRTKVYELISIERCCHYVDKNKIDLEKRCCEYMKHLFF